MKRTKPKPTERQIGLLRSGLTEAITHTPRDPDHPFIYQLEQWGLMARLSEKGEPGRTDSVPDARVWTSATTLDGVTWLDGWDEDHS